MRAKADWAMCIIVSFGVAHRRARLCKCAKAVNVYACAGVGTRLGTNTERASATEPPLCVMG